MILPLLKCTIGPTFDECGVLMHRSCLPGSAEACERALKSGHQHNSGHVIGLDARRVCLDEALLLKPALKENAPLFH